MAFKLAFLSLKSRAWSGILVQGYQHCRVMSSSSSHSWSNHLGGNMEMNVSEDRTEASAVLPGFAFGDLDRTGNVEVSRMLLLLAAARDNCCFKGDPAGRDFFRISDLLKERMVFIMATQMQVSRNMYDRKNDFLYEPVQFSGYLNKVGKTSLEIFTFLDSPKGFPLVSVGQVVVFVDRHHSPVEHPPKYRETYADLKPRSTIERFVKEEKPDSAFHTSYRVVWSDTDFFYHANQCSYLRFTMNAATEAGYAGHLKQFGEGDIARHKISALNMVFAAQSAPGDNLDIYVWEDSVKKRRIHCQMYKGKTNVYNTTVDFHENANI